MSSPSLYLPNEDLSRECHHCGTDCADMDMLAGGERKYTSCQTFKREAERKAKAQQKQFRVTIGDVARRR